MRPVASHHFQFRVVVISHKSSLDKKCSPSNEWWIQSTAEGVEVIPTVGIHVVLDSSRDVTGIAIQFKPFYLNINGNRDENKLDESNEGKQREYGIDILISN